MRDAGAQPLDGPTRVLPSVGRAATPLLVGVLWATGMLLDHYPMLLTGLGRMQGEWNDARLNNYFLEHSWRWLLQMPTDRSFWNIPAFFPAPNGAAYSELLLTLAPVYWSYRATGLPPDAAFQLWLLTMATLNYVACWLLLRHSARVGAVPAGLGAFVFAFGSSRGAQMMHAQLVPQFLPIVALYALWRLFDRAAEDSPWRSQAVALFFLSLVGQLYAGFYHAWLFGVALLVAGIWALASGDSRRVLLAVLSRERWRILAWGAVCVALVWPLASHYLRAAQEVGFRSFSMIEPLLPRPASWIYMGADNRLYGELLFRDTPFSALPMEHEQRLGLGFVTPVAAIVGLWRARHRVPHRLMLLTAGSLVAVATLWAPGLTGWHLVYRIVPGANALRAVSRIGMELLIPAAFGVALTAQALRAHRSAASYLALACLAVVVVAEQGQRMISYDRDAARERPLAVARAVPRGCAGFLYTPIATGGDPWWYHGDAMWAAWESGVPTVNGYSGNTPPSWSFYATIAHTPREDSLLGVNLGAWAEHWRLDPGTLCRVRLTEPESALLRGDRRRAP